MRIERIVIEGRWDRGDEDRGMMEIEGRWE